MGEVADDIVNGACCSECGFYFDQEFGYPTLCESCQSHKSQKGHEEQRNREGYQLAN